METAKSKISQRNARLLEAVIREYIRTAEPVASGHLHGRFGFTESPATLRAALAELEKDGYLQQPHTSAGRIPTEKGYRYYIEHCLEKEARAQKTTLPEVQGDDLEKLCKEVARALAEITGEAAFVGVGGNVSYYTGLARLFAKPEFRESAQMLELGEVFDHFDELIGDLTGQLADEVQILVGRDNPLGKACSSIVIKFPHRSDEEIVLGLLGPMRMDYQQNIDALTQAHRLLEKAFRLYE